MEKCENAKMLKWRGFTIIEIIVVISIIIFLSASVLPNYRQAASKFALERATYKLAQDIRRTAEMAMSAKELPGGVMPAGGYGIFFDPDWNKKRYRLYADKDGDEFFTGLDTIIEDIELEKGIVIQGIDTPLNKVGINFKPPAPIVKIKYSSIEEVNEVIITLALEADTTKTRTVKVNKAGLIDVE